jgi:hypothetical protein
VATAAQRAKASATIMPRLLSRLQAAAYVGLSATEFDAWAKQQRLKPIRHGRRVLFDRQRLDLIIDRMMEELDDAASSSDLNNAYAPDRQTA